ncbi:hypothetical protein EDD21DRAFT_112568 [Dissophora ornata]|nr:hypothetical protein EDD21DRAFT_112568 [Dissophora ornata]
MFLRQKLAAALLLLAIAPSPAFGGLITYAVCQSYCNVLAVGCYTFFGFTFGTITVGLGTPLVILGCNAMLGTCMSTCILLGFTPTP